MVDTPIPLSGKPSKAPLYAEALRIYLEEPSASLMDIAGRVGLRVDALIKAAESQAWSKRRALVLRDKSQERATAVVQTDSVLVAATVNHVAQLTEGWRDVVEKILALPTEPEKDAPDANEARARLLSRKSNLMRTASQGFREVADVAQTLGLLRTPKKDEVGDGKIDLSKLTQLNITVQQAMREIEPVPVVELAPADGEDLI